MKLGRVASTDPPAPCRPLHRGMLGEPLVHPRSQHRSCAWVPGERGMLREAFRDGEKPRGLRRVPRFTSSALLTASSLNSTATCRFGIRELFTRVHFRQLTSCTCHSSEPRRSNRCRCHSSLPGDATTPHSKVSRGRGPSRKPKVFKPRAAVPRKNHDLDSCPYPFARMLLFEDHPTGTLHPPS